MPGRRTQYSRGLGVLIGLVALLTGAGAIGNGTQAAPPSIAAAPTASATVSPEPNVAAEVPSGAAPTRSQSTLRPMVQATAAPLITGDARYGMELTFAKPTWRPGRVTLAYQWLRDGAAIPGATTRRHAVTAGDIGHELSVRITGTRTGYQTAVQETAPVGPVVGSRLTSEKPWLYGVAQVGRTLVGGVRAWGPGDVRLSWQWYRDGVRIPGATGTTYELAAADAGHRIRFGVRGSAPRFETATRLSTATGPVAEGVLRPTPVPLYSGVARVGETLTALPRQWGPGDVTLSYQWYRSGEHGDVRIKGAKRAKYTLVDADAGHRLKVRVTGREAGYTTVQRFSAWTSVVGPSPDAADTGNRNR